MYSNLNKYKFTYSFIISSLLIFLIDNISNIHLFNILNLNVYSTVYQFQLWRIFTYPFVNNNIVELIITLTLGGYFISKFEDFVTSKYISITFVYYTLIFGLLHTVLNINLNTKIYFGSESFIIFCIINYIFLNEFQRFYNYFINKFQQNNIFNSFDNNFKNEHNKTFNFKNRFLSNIPKINEDIYYKNKSLPILSLKNLLFSYNLPILTLSLWFFKEIYSYTTLIDYNIYSCLIEFSFAIFAAILLKNNVYVYENIDNLNINKSYKNLDEIEENTFAHSVIGQSNISKLTKPKTQNSFKDEKLIIDNFNSSFAENYYLYDNNTTEEEKIDEILDRINEIGKDQLTKEELNFLIKYSEHNN